MATAVQEQRLTQRFMLWDTDGDGRIERADCEDEARNILRAFGEPEEASRGHAVVDAYLTMWDYLADRSGVGSRGSMSVEQFNEVAAREIVSRGDAGFSKVLRPTITAIVTMCDTDGDGRVNPDEFRRWLNAMGVPKAQHEESFRRMDADNDGYLSVEELVQAFRYYLEGTLDVPLLGR
jgi:Ca2+-binding EF-hand superfamily protein